MSFFMLNFKWVMLLSGLLTCTMLLGVVSPENSLKTNFGDKLEGPLAGIIVRNWAALIGLIGIMLIYGAFTPTVRRFSLIIAGISKCVFIILILSLGQTYLKFGVGTAVIIDSIMVALFITYLLLSRSFKLS
jgi:uncharacterized RDD family membrane protein YckC